MSDFQAIIDFSFQVNKFVNIDLFQRGLYQIRMQLKLPNCKLPYKIEVNQSLSSNVLSANPNSGSSSSSNGGSSLTLSSSSSSLTTNTSNGTNQTKSSHNHTQNHHPHKNASSSSKQKGKSNNQHHHSSSSTSDQTTGANASFSSNSIVYPATIIGSTSATSKTFAIVYKNEEVQLNDSAHFRVHLCLDAADCREQIASKITFLLSVELWFTDQEEEVLDRVLLQQTSSFYPLPPSTVDIPLVTPFSPSVSALAAATASANFTLASSRQLQLHFDLTRGLHYNLPVIFDYFHLSAITLTVHASLVTICAPYISGSGNGGSGNGSNSNINGSSSKADDFSLDNAAAWLSNFATTSKSDLLKEEKRLMILVENTTGNNAENRKHSLQMRRLQLAQYRLVSLIAESLLTLRRKVDEYYRLLPPWQQARLSLESLLVDLTSVFGSSNGLSELSQECFRRLQVEQKTQSEQKEESSTQGSKNSLQSLESLISVSSNKNNNANGASPHPPNNNQSTTNSDKLEEALSTVQRDISHLCALTIDQWGRFLRLASHCERINQHLAKGHHLQRIRRFAEAFFTAELPRSDLYGLTDETSARFAELSEAARKSVYLTRLPPCSVECLALDGDAASLPVIFEQAYEAMSNTEEVAIGRSLLKLEQTSLNGSSFNFSSPSKQSLSSLSTASTSSSSHSSNSSANNKNSNIRSLLTRLNYIVTDGNGNKKHSKNLGVYGGVTSGGKSKKCKSGQVVEVNSKTQINSAIDLISLYGTDLFTASDQGGEQAALSTNSVPSIDASVGRRIKLLNSLLTRKELLKSSYYSKLYYYSPSAAEQQNQKENLKKEILSTNTLMTTLLRGPEQLSFTELQSAVTDGDEVSKNDQLESNSRSWPNLTNSYSSNQLLLSSTTQALLYHRKQQQLEQHQSSTLKSANHNKNAETGSKKGALFSHHSTLGKSKSDSLSMTDDQLMSNVATATSLKSLTSDGGPGGRSSPFQGTMYFPKPPKEFASMDEPAEEVNVKSIPVKLSSTTITITEPPSHHHHQKKISSHRKLNTPDSILINGISNTTSGFDSVSEAALLLRAATQLNSLNLKGSSSCQDLTERLEREKARLCKAKSKEKLVDKVDVGEKPQKHHPKPEIASKDDAYLHRTTNPISSSVSPSPLIISSTNTTSISVSEANKFTFLELLRSDHCLVCSGSITSSKTPSQITAAVLDQNSWPCVCNQQKKQHYHSKKKKSKTLLLQQQQHQAQETKAISSITESSKNPPESSEQHLSTLRRLSSTVGANTADLLSFLTAKEAFRNGQPLLKDKSLLFYSDYHTLASRIPYFQCDPDFRAFNSHKDLHLIVCVHGLDGNSADLRLVRTYLELGLPTNNFEFLMSARNQGETFDSLETLTTRLVGEIDTYVTAFKLNPARISFIGHSLGNIIIRSAISRADFIRRWGGKMHTFLSLSGPHLGLAYNRSGLVNMGLWFIQKFKKSASLTQLSMKDSPNIRQTFLYQLSTKPGLEHFRHVLLCGSSQDYYVPIHSAHIELCNAALADSSENGVCYREMANNILERLVTRAGLNIVRYDVHHALSGNNANSLIGRAAHIAVLDSELFIEKFMVVVGLKYFV